MSQTFFTSDLHFGHKNIIKFCPDYRPQTDDIKEHDEFLINNWNSIITPEDTVYNLGDVSFSHDKKRIESVLSRLNGKHHLILGNHDGLIAQNQAYFLSKTKQDGNPLLSSIQDYLKIKINKQTLILFHYPIQEWDGCQKGYYHLYGHLHNREANIKGRILNVGFDFHGRILSFDEVDNILKHKEIVAYF